MKKPTDRELAILLHEVTGRMPSMPRQEGDVRITKTTYKGADRFELTWRDAAKSRRKLWYRNWRHAMAAAKWANAQIEAANGKTAFTFVDAAKSYLDWCERRSKAKDPDILPNTVNAYRIQVNKAVAKFGRKPLHQIRSQDVNDLLDEQALHLARSSVSNIQLAVDQVFKHATRHRMVDMNPLVVEPVKFRGRRRKRVAIPDRSDMERLREFINGPRPYKHSRLTWSSMRVAIVLAGTCGLRAGEVCGLRWDRIDPVTREIDVTDVVTADSMVKPYPKTETSFRKVPLTIRAQEIFEEHAVIYKEFFGKLVGHVVRNDRKGEFIPGAKVNPMFAPVMSKAGLVNKDGKPKFTFHALRHWCAAHWLRATGGDVHLVAKWLGHKHASVTLNTYGHALDDAAGRERFLQMPDWLDPIIEIGGPAARPSLPAQAEAVNGSELSELAPQPEGPIPLPPECETWLRAFVADLWRTRDVRGAIRSTRRTRYVISAELRRWHLPTIDEIVAMAGEEAGELSAMPLVALPAPAAPAIECPIDLPDHAEEWVRRYIALLDERVTSTAACEMVRRDKLTVKRELTRLNVPDRNHAGDIRELKRRLWAKRVVRLADEGHQAYEIAAKAGGHPVQVMALLATLHKQASRKAMNNNDKLTRPSKVNTRPQHNSQLKLL
jgi:integrase